MNISNDDFLSWLKLLTQKNTTYNEDPMTSFWTTLTTDPVLHYLKITFLTVFCVVIAGPIVVQLIFLSLNFLGAVYIGAYFQIRARIKGEPKIDQKKLADAVSIWWKWIAKIWFDYKVLGLERVPFDRPVLWVSTHGAVPAPAFAAYYYSRKVRHNRRIFSVIAKSHVKMNKVPLMNNLFDMLGFGGWDREECVKILKHGHDVFVMPGGAREVRSADSSYKVDWERRKGFARVAREAEAVIIPCFTVNMNEAFWTPFYAAAYLRSKWAPENMNVQFTVGGLPVRMTSLVGKPIYCDSSLSVDEIFEKTVNSIKQLRDANQRIPGNKFFAVLDRFRKPKYKYNFDDEVNGSVINI